MISYRDNESSGFGVEGFIPSVLNMAIDVTEGRVSLGEVIHDYPNFSFDIESDEIVNVVYDVYLLDTHDNSEATIHIDRTEIGGDTIAHYQESYKMIHCIMTLLVPPKSTNLDDVNIIVNRVTDTNENII